MKSEILCLAALCLIGCASLAEPSRFALFVPPETTPVADAADVEASEEDENPFKKSKDKSDSDAGPAPIASSAGGDLDELDFDEETKELIAARLAELPSDPQLRKERIAAWKKLSSTEVRRIIRVERLADSVSEQKTASADQPQIRTVAANKSTDDEVFFVPNADAGHSGFPDRSPFVTSAAPAPERQPVPLARSITESPVQLLPAENPQPQSPLGAALNQTQVQQQQPPGNIGNANPFQQQPIQLPELPPAESVVMVPQQVENQPPATAQSPIESVNPFAPPGATAQSTLPNTPPGQTPPANGTDPSGNGFVRGLTSVPQSLRQFGATLARPFGGQAEDQPAAPQVFGTAPPAAVNPTGANPMLDRQALLTQLISLTEQELNQLTPEQRHDYVQKNVYLRMLYMMSQQEERSLQYIPGLEPANQEFWQQLFWALSNYFDQQSIPDAQARASQTVAQLHTAAQRLQEQANLELRNVNFCHEINSYGDYKKFPLDEFAAGEGVLIYAEVANFKSELTGDGRYRTLLKTTIEFYRMDDESGPVAVETIEPKEDLCRNYRRDFFNGYNLHIPDNLTPGQYYMRLRLEDQLSNKIATETIKFRVQ